MKSINIHEAKTHLSRLIERVEAGEEFVIARAGKPAARLVPLERVGRAIKPGNMKFPKGMADNWNTLYEKEIEKLFYGEPLDPGRSKPRRK